MCSCRFISTDLAAVNRTVTPWVVVNGHRPIYTTSTSGGSITSVIQVADDLRDSLEELFYKYQVSLLPLPDRVPICHPMVSHSVVLLQIACLGQMSARTIWVSPSGFWEAVPFLAN